MDDRERLETAARVVAVVFVAADLADLWTTSHGTPAGEINRIARTLWTHHGFGALVALKAAQVVACLVPLFWLVRRGDPRLTRSWLAGCAVNALTSTLAAIHNAVALGLV